MEVLRGTADAQACVELTGEDARRLVEANVQLDLADCTEAIQSVGNVERGGRQPEVEVFCLVERDAVREGVGLTARSDGELVLYKHLRRAPVEHKTELRDIADLVPEPVRQLRRVNDDWPFEREVAVEVEFVVELEGCGIVDRAAKDER